jgi:hypothetical protein
MKVSKKTALMAVLIFNLGGVAMAENLAETNKEVLT